MSAADLTGIVALTVAVLTGIVVPFVAGRRKKTQRAGDTEVVSWKGITAVLQTERDTLRKEMGEMEREHKREMAAQVANYAKQLAEANARIAQLEKEVDTLYRRLYQQGPPVPPT